MPGRKYEAQSGYRYGFNGKEKDNEAKGEGNQQDYGLRIYDTRLGKFLSVDPIFKSYPMLTPYQFASNVPIWCIDLDGGESKTATEYLVDFINWLGQSDNSLEEINKGKGPIGEKIASFNKNVNPVGVLWYGGYQTVTGNDFDTKLPAQGGRLKGVSDLGVNAIMYASGEKFLGMFNSTPALEGEMNLNRQALSTSAKIEEKVVEKSTTTVMNKPVPRPSWSQSENYVGTFLKNQTGQEFKPQVSFLGRTEVKYGRAGSARPDFYNASLNEAVEVKNYNLANNINGLVKSIVDQANYRLNNLPLGTKQTFYIDTRGQGLSFQAYTQAKSTIISAITAKVNSALSIGQNLNIIFIK
ncbi:MAG: hypothetical protein HYZ15_06485 [Sphingobacteriales bacterium]|nr:hypothetical protein [Sphingobacteriales bacterium]